MRVIKRYPNRKLYDTTARQYVTLQSIKELIGQGEAVQVVDSRSGKDVTHTALSKIVLENGRESGGGLPTSILTDIIKRSGQRVIGYLRKSWDAGRGTAQWAQEEVDRSVKSLVRLGKLSISDAEGLGRDLAARVKGRLAEQESLLERNVRTGVERALHSVNLPTRGDLDEVRARLNRMEARIDHLLGNGRASGGRGGRLRRHA
jgi:polyhydroxyalkanoate synthesis repressor PhaR